MSFQFLISTMNQVDYALLDRLQICGDSVVVNQCGYNSQESFTKEGHHILWINTDERGLSKSRNMAFRNATASICLLVDDDEILDPVGKTRIQEAFEQYPDISLMRFQVEGIEHPYKTYGNKVKRVGYLTSGRASSVEIAFRRKDILQNGIQFDELIGAGTDLYCGEENAFLFSCFRKRLKMLYIPVCIAKLHMDNSSWFVGFNRQYFQSRGAALTAMSHLMGKPFIFAFALKHRDIMKKVGFFSGISYMLEGAKIYSSKKRSEHIGNKSVESIK